MPEKNVNSTYPSDVEEEEEEDGDGPIIRTCSTTLTTLRLSAPQSSSLRSSSPTPSSKLSSSDLKYKSDDNNEQRIKKGHYHSIRLRIIHNECIWICRWIAAGLIFVNSIWLSYNVFAGVRDRSNNVITNSMIIMNLFYGLLSFTVAMFLWRRLWLTNHYTSFALFNISFILFIVIELLQLSYWFIVRFTPTNSYHNWETLSFYGCGSSRLISYLELLIFLNSTKLSTFKLKNNNYSF